MSVSRRTVLLALSSLFAVPAVRAAGTSEADALRKMHAFIEATPYAQGRFRQTSVDREGRETAAPSEGIFRFLRPGFFEWSTQKPYEQKIFSNARQLWIYDPDLAQVTVRRITQEMTNSPAGLLFGTDNLEKVARLSMADPDTVAADFFNKGGIFSSALVRFKGNELASLTLKDNFGQTVTVEFLEFTLSEQNKGSFEFRIPRGADVLEM